MNHFAHAVPPAPHLYPDSCTETWTAGHEYYNTSAYAGGKAAGMRAPEAGFDVKAAFMGQLLTRRLTANHPAEEMPHQVWFGEDAWRPPYPGSHNRQWRCPEGLYSQRQPAQDPVREGPWGLTWACYGGKNTGTVFSPAFNSLWVFRDAKDGNSIKVWICTAAGARGKPSFPYVGFGTETTRSKAGIRFHPLSSEENMYSISLQDQPLVLEINAQYAYLKDPAASPYLKISVLIEPATKKQIDAIVNVGDLVAKATAMVALMHKAELVIQIYQQYFPDMDFSQVIYNTENDLQAAHVGEGKSFKDRLLNSIQADLAGAAMASVTDLLSKDKLWVVKPQLIKESDATEE